MRVEKLAFNFHFLDIEIPRKGKWTMKVVGIRDINQVDISDFNSDEIKKFLMHIARR